MNKSKKILILCLSLVLLLAGGTALTVFLVRQAKICKVHTYENICTSEVCSVCGKKREAPGHQFNRTVSVQSATCAERELVSDVCSVCGARSEARAVGDLLPHTYAADCATACGVCGQARATAVLHDFDANNVCTLCGQTAAQSECQHVFATGCAAVCEKCGFTRQAGHAYRCDCDAYCRYCGECTRPTAAHTDTDHNGVCDICALPLGTQPSGGIGDIVWFDN